MVRTLRALAALVLSLTVLVAATGWLYLARPAVTLPGPVIRDALALDELSHHAGVPLLLFLGVWAVASVLLGLLARWAGLERLSAGLLLAAGVVGWHYALNGVSILVVRQIPAHAAFHAAAAEPALALPAALAGVAGAILGRPRNSVGRRSRTALATLVGFVGLLALLDAAFPEHRASLVTAVDPAHVHGITKALVAPLAVALVVAARSLALGNRRAWQVAVALLTVLLVLHIERRFDDGAVITGIAVLALLARRGSFTMRGDPSVRPRVFLHACLLAAGVAVYGIATLWINRVMADTPFTFSFAFEVIGRALTGLSFRGENHLSGPVANWLPISIFLLGFGSAAFVLVEWLAPWRYRLRREHGESELAQTLVSTWGADTLAPFALRADKSYFFSPDRSAFLAYRVASGVAIVAGDPIGPQAAHEELVRNFLDFAHERGWRVAVLGVCEECLGLYRALGLRALYHGDEAVVDTATFSLDGRAIRKVRQSVHRLERAGFVVRVLHSRDLDVELRVQLEEIGRVWRGAAPERGWVMAMDTLFHTDDDDMVFVVGFDPDGRAQGFLHFGVSKAGSALSLSSMPRLPDVPNGFTEWLICSSIEWAQARGFARVSLNFAPFAALLAPEAQLALWQRVVAATLRRLKGWFQLDNLLLFNRKFAPAWEPRFLVYERRRDLPRVGIAALAVEAYLPFQ
ncbi:MAG TPA: phosphatidylglycerol lysyltransferase domain-containing protein [Gaiellaceae bacterium]|nr:phosphatidylglycerol lysyltransferase domain-containing protein [Gaiellaceae bacterium]